MLSAEGLDVTLGGRPVLAGIDAMLPGGLIGVIGPNGAGKSTLARALLGLVPAAAGRVLLDGRAIGKLPRGLLARSIAYLPQGQLLHWPITVERLVGLGRLPHLAPLSRVGEADRAAIAEAMRITDTLALADRIATDLSGGERARVMLARALAVGAPALIVDEPLAALDPRHQLEVMTLLATLAQGGRLVVAVLHDLGLAARFCDRLLLLHQGRLVADGTPAEVLTDAALDTVYGIAAWRGRIAGQDIVVPLSCTD